MSKRLVGGTVSELAMRREDCAAGSEVVLPPFSMDILLVCLARLNGQNASVPIKDERHVYLVPTEQLNEIARDHGWEARLIHLGWLELRALLINAPALLILGNGNVVLAIPSNAQLAAEEIIVPDPLYSDGADFFVPRKTLEGAWGGIALAVKPLSPPRKRLVAWLARFRAGDIMTGPLLLYPSEASINQSPAFLFTSSPSVEAKISTPQMQQAGVRAGAVPWVSGNALLLLTEALNPLKNRKWIRRCRVR